MNKDYDNTTTWDETIYIPLVIFSKHKYDEEIMTYITPTSCSIFLCNPIMNMWRKNYLLKYELRTKTVIGIRQANISLKVESVATCNGILLQDS